MANPYSVNVLGGFNVGQGIRQLGQDLDRKEAQEDLQNRRNELQAALLGARQGDEGAIDKLYSLNPEMAIKMESQAKQLAEEGKLNATVNAAALLSEADEMSPEFDQLRQNLLADEMVDFGSDEENLSNEQLKTIANVFLRRQKLDRESSSQIPAGQREFENLIKDFSEEDKRKARQIKAGLKGRAVSSAVLSAIESGDVKNLADANRVIEQEKKFGQSTGASRAKFIDKGYETIQGINKNISNIDRAVDALDRGAKTGVVEGQFFPSIKAASRELNQIRNELALDVISSVTFGALSEGELKLAQDTALDTGLNEADLKDYLIRKKAAQEKLRAYFEEQIEHLDQGGTVASFIRMKKREQPKEQEATTINWSDL